ncbi:exosortase A [Candidatus Litorirhabdus singularis]|nr:exosortase A [Candidatus Litorirhabdus singularis]
MRPPALLLVTFYLLLLAIYSDTFFSMVSIWENSQTYAHGFLIIPITCWLIWERREYLAQLSLKPEYLAVLPLAGAVLLWLLAFLVDALVIQQFALVAMLICGTWLILGRSVSLAIAFPLGFLFFMVPVGDDLVPPMMEFTADFTVAAVKLSGIPVYREGLYFSLPTGNWSVVQACSGIRYLIASLTLGCLYAYLTYQTIWKRSLFIIASIIVPVLANGLRAYMIVMIGHFSGMELATGVDHLIYGWVFFGIVMLILFSIGSIWREPAPSMDTPLDGQLTEGRPKQLIAGLVVACATLMLAPTLLSLRADPVVSTVALSLPQRADQWQAVSGNPLQWRPAPRDVDRQALQYFSNGDKLVGLGLQQFYQQEQGRELVRTGDFWFDKSLASSRFAGKGWEEISITDDIRVNARKIRVRVGGDSGNAMLTIYSWYRIGENYTANAYVAKLLEVWSFLSFAEPQAVQYYLVTNQTSPPGGERAVIESFLSDALPEINAALFEPGAQ